MSSILFASSPIVLMRGIHHCASCGKSTAVHMLSGFLGGKGTTFAIVYAISELAGKITQAIPTDVKEFYYRDHIAKDDKEDFFVNHCTKCGNIIIDDVLVGEPEDTFVPLTPDYLDDIDFYQLSVDGRFKVKGLFGGCETYHDEYVLDRLTNAFKIPLK